MAFHWSTDLISGHQQEACCRSEEETREQYKLNGGQDGWDGFKCLPYSYDQSSATPSSCPTTCLTCSNQFVLNFFRHFSDLFRLQMHDDREAAQGIQDWITSTKEDHAWLRQQMSDFGGVVARAWQSKNVQQRKSALVTARPDLYPTKGATFELGFRDIVLPTWLNAAFKSTNLFPQRTMKYRGWHRTLILRLSPKIQ